MTFAERLRAAREASGKPQFEVAYRTTVSLSTYLRWEYGKAEPRVSEVVLLADVLGVEDVRDLLPDIEAIKTKEAASA